MNYDVDLPISDHDAEWLEHYEESGGLQIVCESGDETNPFLISGGWAHFSVCPVCGREIELTTEEI